MVLRGVEKGERRFTLHEVTGAMGDAIKALEARGIKLDDRSIRMFVDAVTDALKAATR